MDYDYDYDDFDYQDDYLDDAADWETEQVYQDIFAGEYDY